MTLGTKAASAMVGRLGEHHRVERDAADCRILAPDRSGAVAQAAVDSTRDGQALQDAFLRAISARHGSWSWTVDHAGWVVTLRSPEEHDSYGKTLGAGLAWRRV